MNEITEDYVSYDVAELLKEKGFNGSCYTYYDDINDTINRFDKGYHFNNTSYPWGVPYDVNKAKKYVVAPTFQMVRKWLRDTYNLYLFNEYFGESKTYKWRIIEMDSTHKHSDFKHYNIEEEATEASFKYALENLI